MTKQEQQKLICEKLNELVEKDPACIHALLCTRIPFSNQKYAYEDKSFQFALNPAGGKQTPEIGALGLINGILDILEIPPVAMKFEISEAENGRNSFVGFMPYNSEPDK